MEGETDENNYPAKVSNPTRWRRETVESGSWSDVSDCDQMSLDTVSKTQSHDVSCHLKTPLDQQRTDKSRSKSGEDGASFQLDSDEISERLCHSLELGQSSFYCVNGLNSQYEIESWYHTNGGSLPFEYVNDSLPSSISSGMTNGAVSSVKHRHKAKHKKEKPNKEDVVDNDQTSDKFKQKFLSAWNNVRHGWTVKTRTNFSYNHPVWILGRWYSSTPQEREDWNIKLERGIPVVTAMEKFKRDFTSRIWFTYRHDFESIKGTQITSDVGWGCMIRSGQMIIAQALVQHFLGRDWRWYPQQHKQDVLYHHKIISFFCDIDSDDCPLSIHKLANIGVKLGKEPGDWYGPASVAYVLRDAMDLVPTNNPILNQMCIYVAQDCSVYKQDVIDLCTSGYKSDHTQTTSTTRGRSNSDTRGLHDPLTRGGSDAASRGRSFSNSAHIDDPWKALILLIPVRLGGESLNTVYTPAIQTILAHDMCIGIIGGKPKHSVFFVGWQEDKLVYLDPHFCQDHIDVREVDAPLSSFHCMSPRKMPFNKMDPSCTIGFYCKTRLDFENFCLEAANMAAPTAKGLYPMFVLDEGRSCDVEKSANEKLGKCSKRRKSQTRQTDKQGKPMKSSTSCNSEDFEFL